MFTLFEKIAGLLLNWMKIYQEQQDRELKRAFSKDIVECYLRLIEVISTGKKIIDDLEFYLSERSRIDSTDNDYWIYLGDNLENTLIEQSINVNRLAKAMLPIRSELCVFAPEVAELLPRTATHKVKYVGRLWGLVHSLREGNLPVIFLSDVPSDKFACQERYYEIMITDWNPKTYKKVFAYLERDNPRENLDKLAECAKQIHEIIIHQFKIEEILWSIDDFKDKL